MEHTNQSTPRYPADARTDFRTDSRRPDGPSWATVAFGLVCLGVAALTLAFQLGDLRVDWAVAGPATVIGAGVLLLLIGLVALLRRDGEEEGG